MSQGFLSGEFFKKHKKTDTLLLFGEADRFIRPKDALRAVEKINNKQIRFRVIKQAGHNIAYEQPKSTAIAIESFLQSK